GRISSEMLQKAARLQAPIVISRTSPSSLSIEMAEHYGITLIGYARRNRFNVYSNLQRVS
ncbi:MAG TPA: formate dehydrogenase accessory sulfurtransferase FdhD, partial [Anaerolineales bacterium]|nr:formate dehydrogenase accessory sulfurtransferase FdhD [Anaerolineales bacterium]